jgi:hypothetical protein
LSWWDTKTNASGKVVKDLPGQQTWMAFAYVMAGRRAEVERWSEVQNEPYRLAIIHAALGNRDRTFEELDKAAGSSRTASCSYSRTFAAVLRTPKRAPAVEQQAANRNTFQLE